jgi:hypothetical protein
MAKGNSGNSKPNTTAPAQAAVPENKGVQEGADNNVIDQNNTGDQANLGDQFVVPAGKVLITLPADVNEGITEFVGQLKAAYFDADVDALLTDRFKPEVDETINEDRGSDDIVLVTGFELAFPLDALADDITQGLLAVQNALDTRSAPEGQTFPEALVGFQFPLTVLERYIQGVLHQGVRLEDVELVIADAEADSHLKTLNFSRLLQGLAPTHVYLRFL